MNVLSLDGDIRIFFNIYMISSSVNYINSVDNLTVTRIEYVKQEYFRNSLVVYILYIL